MVDIPCVDGVCPAIPQCVPVVEGSRAPICPLGEPYTLGESNATLACSPRARALECPQGYTCQATLDAEEGVCCPNPGEAMKMKINKPQYNKHTFYILLVLRKLLGLLNFSTSINVRCQVNFNLVYPAQAAARRAACARPCLRTCSAWWSVATTLTAGATPSAAPRAVGRGAPSPWS